MDTHNREHGLGHPFLLAYLFPCNRSRWYYYYPYFADGENGAQLNQDHTASEQQRQAEPRPSPDLTPALF